MTPDGRSALTLSARSWTETLVGWISVTGSPGEVRFAHRLAAMLRERSCFREDPEAVRLLAVHDEDPRASVLAFVRGQGPDTVLLTGHFDVVGIDEYGELAPVAGQPETLRRGLVERLRRDGGDALALADLESGAFVPGRGMLDMKSGLAAGLAVLEDFAADPDRRGNLVFLAVPDEENQSAGMRSAAPALARFASEKGLRLRLAVNLDAICDTGDGREGQVIATGTIGKLLLGALVVGKEAHACYLLDGVNSAYLAAEIAAEIECAPELSERTGGEIAVPPTLLGSKDLKSAYDVTVPGRTWAFWNVITHRRTAEDVFAVAGGLVRRALARARDHMERRNSRLGRPMTMTDAWSDIAVHSFADIHAAARRRNGGFADEYADAARRLSTRDDMDFPSRTRELAELTWDRAGLPGPAIVLIIGSMPYPARRLAATEEAGRLANVLADVAQTIGREFDTPISLRQYFPAISDMSFLGGIETGDHAFLAANTPLWGSSIVWEPPDGFADLPVVNAGPWGRDYHHWLERTHAFYSFTVLPALLRRICRSVLEGASPTGDDDRSRTSPGRPTERALAAEPERNCAGLQGAERGATPAVRGVTVRP